MQIRGRMRVKSEPCHGCGEVRELVGEYPEWIMLCYPCQGRFICICCGVPTLNTRDVPRNTRATPTSTSARTVGTVVHTMNRKACAVSPRNRVSAALP